MTQFWQELTAQEREFWGTTPPPRRVRLRTALRGRCCLRTTVGVRKLHILETKLGIRVWYDCSEATLEVERAGSLFAL